METASIYKVRRCFQCPGETEHYCVSCPCYLCLQCKESHLIDLKTIDHDVVSYSDKIYHIPIQEIWVRHLSYFHIENCKLSFYCRKNRNHEQLVVKPLFNTKREQHREIIHIIRSEALFYRYVLLTQIKANFKTCHTEFSLYQSEILTKAKKLKDFIGKDLRHVDFKHRCLKQKKEMIRYIFRLQRYVHIYEQSALKFSSLQFLSSIKTVLPQIHLTHHTSQFSMTESLNKEDVMGSLIAIQMTERGNRRVGNECLLKLTSCATFHQSLTVTNLESCDHISCVTSDRVWVSDEKNFILVNSFGVTLHRVKGLCSGFYIGPHTVNSEGVLIYIDENHNINKLSKNMKTVTTLLERRDSKWWPQCVYWSPSTEDLLVGMYFKNTETKMGKVTRFKQGRLLTQTIEHDSTGRKLYSKPNYITENNNGDVVVSDFWGGAIVVTERKGKHRFSYTGHPSDSQLVPHGICTDALSHILLCDLKTKTVHMLNKDGMFLSYLQPNPLKIFSPHSLSYDVKTHRLWVGSWDNNEVCVYRYITRQDALTDTDKDSLSSAKPTRG